MPKKVIKVIKKKKEMKKSLAVIGIGRVGLPLALSFAEAGLRVYGIDVNKDHIDTIKSKTMPYMEDGAEPLLKKHLNKNFFPTMAITNVKKCDYIVLTLGTPVDEHMNPEYKQILCVLSKLAPQMKKGQTLILRSTVAPRSTENVKRIIEKNTGMTVGEDIYLAFCPERIAQGKAIEEIADIPQIIGTLDDKSTEKADKLFKMICKETLPTDATSAELAKIFTNMYRYINFAIANQFMIFAEEHGRDIHEITRLVNHNYSRGGLKSPGLTAGPCLYKDGFFLLDTMPFSELISTSWKINENIPLYLLKKIKETTDIEKKKVALLGMAFKANNDDTRNSLSFKLKKALQREDLNLIMHDPHVKHFQNDMSMVLKDADIIILGINHDHYADLGLAGIKKHAKKDALICDVWNMFDQGKVLFRLDEAK